MSRLLSRVSTRRAFAPRAVDQGVAFVSRVDENRPNPRRRRVSLERANGRGVTGEHAQERALAMHSNAARRRRGER